MHKIIFIAGLSHSGSTLCDLLLGSNSKAVSMGELDSTIQRFNEPQRICTCGNEIDQCIVWGKLKSKRKGISNRSFIKSYSDIIETVESVYGKEKFIIDSSKNFPTLKKLIESGIKDVYILFIIKDIRSYVISTSFRKYKKKLMEKDGWRRIYTTSILYNIFTWYYFNKRIKTYLEKNNIKYFQFGYEELCFKPTKILNMISDFIGIKYEDNMLIPAKGESHIIRGNEMRYDKNKLKSIKYDMRWLFNKKHFFFTPFFFPFMNWNFRNVYSNIDENL